MVDKLYTSDLTWRTEKQQDWTMRMIPSGTIYRNGQRDEMLRPSQRKDPFKIHVASTAVLSDNEKDFRKFMQEAWKRKATIIDVEEVKELPPGTYLVKAVEQWKEARKNGVAKVGGQISAKLRKEKSAEAIAKIKDRWPLPSKEWPTKVLLKEAGVSLNTVKSLLGKRPIAQYNYQAKLKRKANVKR
jgi:hypothetical protein